MFITYAPQAYKLLNGLLAVYKPTGVPVVSFAQEICHRLLLGEFLLLRQFGYLFYFLRNDIKKVFKSIIMHLYSVLD